MKGELMNNNLECSHHHMQLISLMINGALFARIVTYSVSSNFSSVKAFLRDIVKCFNILLILEVPLLIAASELQLSGP